MHTDEILDILEAMFPDAHCELIHKNPFELLVAVVLSAQTTDEAVNKVTPGLFAKFPTPEAMANASLEDIVTRKLKTKDFEKVERTVEERYHAKHIEVSLGYGYDNPVYVVECDKGLILLDYDTLKEVYYLKDGDV